MILVSIQLIGKVSIPQAVGTIAIFYNMKDILSRGTVSIPQAVGTIAIFQQFEGISILISEFQYRKR